MLESEAKRKRCPFSKENCIGEECMLWRSFWETSDHPDTEGDCKINLLEEITNDA